MFNKILFKIKVIKIDFTDYGLIAFALLWFALYNILPPKIIEVQTIDKDFCTHTYKDSLKAVSSNVRIKIRNLSPKPGFVDQVEIQKIGVNSNKYRIEVTRIDKKKITFLNSEIITIGFAIYFKDSVKWDEPPQFRMTYKDNTGKLINRRSDENNTGLYLRLRIS